MLLWNAPTIKFGLPPRDVLLEVTLKNLAVTLFDLEAYIIDEKKQPGVSPHPHVLPLSLAELNTSHPANPWNCMDIEILFSFFHTTMH